jgi:hypothetical protein
MEGIAMPAPGFSSVAVDLANVQGLVHAFYPCECARYLLFSLGDGTGPVDGRGFLRGLLPRVTVALADPASAGAFVNIGLSFEGLQRLGVEPAVLDEFPDDFRNGPDHIALGDVGVSAPGPWRTAAFPSSGLHMLVQLTGHTDGDIASASADVRARRADAAELLPTSDGVPIDGRHLGGGACTSAAMAFPARRGVFGCARGRRTGQLPAFRLGYSTKAISSSPKVVGSRPTTSADAVELVQDAATPCSSGSTRTSRFNWFPDRAPGGARPPPAQELLAAKLMGRWRDGTPRAVTRSPVPDLVARNDFK